MKPKPKPTPTPADLYTSMAGSIVYLEAGTDAGRRFMRLVGNGRPTQYADHRTGVDIIEAALDSGLVCEDIQTGRRAQPRPDTDLTVDLPS